MFPVHVIRDHTLKYHPKWSILKAKIIPENHGDETVSCCAT